MSRNLPILFTASLVVSAIGWHLVGAGVLSAEGAGLVLAVTLGIMGIAFVLALIPAGIYWLIEGSPMPYLSVVVWGLWGLLTLAYLVHMSRPSW